MCTGRRLSPQSVETHGLGLILIAPQQQNTVEGKILTFQEISEWSERKAQRCKVAYFGSSTRSSIGRGTIL